jgi:hypothetical protein
MQVSELLGQQLVSSDPPGLRAMPDTNPARVPTVQCFTFLFQCVRFGKEISFALSSLMCAAIQAISRQRKGVVFMLWGKPAQVCACGVHGPWHLGY